MSNLHFNNHDGNKINLFSKILERREKINFNILPPLCNTNIKGGNNNSFRINDSQKFFIERLNTYTYVDFDPVSLLKNLTSKVKMIKIDDIDLVLEEFTNITNEIYDVILNLQKKYPDVIELNDIDWHHLPSNPEIIKILWALRDVFVSICFEFSAKIHELFLGTTIRIGKNKERIIPKELIFPFTSILGSTTLISDIDVTIEGTASIWIAIIEDLWDFSWFDNEKWTVDLYGDFTMIGRYYIDFKFIEKSTKIELLVLAVASYFKHEFTKKYLTTNDKELAHNIELKFTVLEKLIKYIIDREGLLITKDEIMEKGKTMILENLILIDKTAQRNNYYELLKNAEKLEAYLTEVFKDPNIDRTDVNNQLGQVMIKLGKANLFREENYILPSTVIHVVKTEQAKLSSNDFCTPILISSANCALNTFTYLLSAIEQLGYLQENLHHGSGKYEFCTLKAAKYFGRFVRAIKKGLFDIIDLSDIYVPNSTFNNLVILSEKLDAEKKRRGTAGDTDPMCENREDLYNLLRKLFSKFKLA